jgi:branched-chain amino acid transport system permease protein
MESFLQNLILGVQLGSLYALIALGYTMVYGVLRLINFAHGDVYMVGAFVGYYASTRWLPFQDLNKHPEAGATNIALAFCTLLLAMAVCAALTVVIERFAYRPLRNGLKNADAHFWGFIAALPVTAKFAGTLGTWPKLGAYVVISIGLGFLLRPVIAWMAQRIKLSNSRLNALITAIGVSLVLENGGILVFGATPQFIGDLVPEKSIQISKGIQISSGYLAIFVVSMVLMLTLRYIVLYTKRGKAMRAISHDIDAAKLMGIDTDRIISFTFALGGSLAGAAGAMVAILTHIKITPLFGLQPGLKAFVAAVLGGAGNIPGAVAGSMVMGTAESFVQSSQYNSFRDAIAFLLLIVVLLVKPAGLFGKNVAEKV